MPDRLDEPGDPFIDRRINRLAARIAALEAGNEEIEHEVEEIEHKVGELVTRESAKPQLHVVKGGDDA